MYSPRIRDDLIPPIYHAAKHEGVAMTTWVSRAVEAALAGRQQVGGEEPERISSEKTPTPIRSAQRGGERP